MSLRPIFVASLGNPAPYTNTLHSAGHLLLTSLLTLLPSQPPLTRSSKSSALVSEGPSFTFWQSPSYMNVSGPPLARAWRTYLHSLPSDTDPALARLVILHDELESPLGRVKVKTGGSVRGHNGLKSCVEVLGSDGFARVSVGIGRPESKYRDDVSRFVLRKMKGEELESVKEAAREVLVILETMRQADEGLAGASRY